MQQSSAKQKPINTDSCHNEHEAVLLLLQEQFKQFHENIPTSLGGLEPPTFRLTVERANRLRHRDKLAHF